MSFENYEENDYGDELDLLIILVITLLSDCIISYSTRNGCKVKSHSFITSWRGMKKNKFFKLHPGN